MEDNLTGVEQEEFLKFVQYMLQWKPEDCMAAKQLLPKRVNHYDQTVDLVRRVLCVRLRFA